MPKVNYILDLTEDDKEFIKDPGDYFMEVKEILVDKVTGDINMVCVIHADEKL